MPTQRFAPMTKDFPTFDCDAHVVEPALVWEMAADSLSKDELEALKATMWYDARHQSDASSTARPISATSTPSPTWVPARSTSFVSPALV